MKSLTFQKQQHMESSSEKIIATSRFGKTDQLPLERGLTKDGFDMTEELKDLDEGRSSVIEFKPALTS